MRILPAAKRHNLIRPHNAGPLASLVVALETTVLLGWFLLSLVALVAVLRQLARAIAIRAAIEDRASLGVKAILKARVRDMAIFVPGAGVSLCVSSYLVWQHLLLNQPINWFLPTATNLFLLIIGGGVVLLHEIDDKRGAAPL